MNSELKVSVYWGDILYDTALCGPGEPFTVGLTPGNSFILPVDGSLRGSIELVTMHDKDNAEIRFNDQVSGHVNFKNEILPLQVVKKSNRASQGADGLYHLRIGREEKAALVIGHVSFYLDWVKSFEVVPRSSVHGKKSLLYGMLSFLLLSLMMVVIYTVPDAPEEKPPERVVAIESVPLVRVKPVVVPESKAAVGAKKTKTGGAARGDLGKVAVKKKADASASLRDANLGGLVKDLSSLGANVPSGRSKKGSGASSGLDQVGTGGFSTEGLKTGGGGNSVGIGRTVGQGEGGFEGTGRLGLSGNSIKDGSGSGGGNSVTRGGLDREVINAVVRRRQDRIRLCYERQLNFSPKLSGKVTVDFTIGKTGNVITSRIAEDTMKNDNVRECILSEVNTWNFPAPVGGTLVHVDYPFVFESSARGLASP
jgi:hypothetical protein